MQNIDVNLIILISVSMICLAFFSGMEIAFVSSNRMLIEINKDKGGLSRKVLNIFYRYPNNFVSTMVVGNNIAFIIYGILMAKLLDNTLFATLDTGAAIAASTILSAVIVLFTGEFLPKSLFKSNSNRLLIVFAVPAYLCYIILWPISKFTALIADLLLRTFGIKIIKTDEDEEFSKVDLDYLIHSSIDNANSDEDIEDEVKIFQNALDFHDTKVRDCMVPRIEINAVDIDDCTIEQLKQKFIESGNSKIIVYKGDIDHPIGYIHSSEMFRDVDNWHDAIRTIPFVPETMAVQKLLQMLLQQKKSLGIVIDEFGGTSGIISLEDIVEEIFGEIEDEHDNAKYVAKQVNDNEFILSARLEIDKVNEMFDLNLPESDDYMTLGGLILHYYQSFPNINDVIKIAHFEFKIIKNTTTKIELVRLKINK